MLPIVYTLTWRGGNATTCSAVIGKLLECLWWWSW